MRVFSVDAETDALYGEPWAIGAVLLDGADVLAEFKGQINPEVAVTDPWVRENIVPVVDLPRFPTQQALLNAFWWFWIQHGKEADAECVGDFGTPVEAFLFRRCIDQNREERMWQGPYPLHELGTALLLADLDPDATNRREFAGRPDLVQHDPYDDALAAGLCWQKLRGRLS